MEPKTTSRSIALSAREDAALVRLAHAHQTSISAVVRALLRPVLNQPNTDRQTPQDGRGDTP